ncbi:MAG TPA: pantetheine-phosphate adenylyltransferase [Actinomycetota bacterium]|nr:pantetheine-phosphate adenylyltransferase [Actinomycetota bacterium]
MTAALCPGSFDPPTNSHVDVIERASRHFDHVVAAVIANPSKHPLFSTEERVDLLRDALGHLDNVEVASFDGLLVDFARERGVTAVVKGLRAVSDYDYELQMAQMNEALSPGLDTFFVPAKASWAFLSSSLVREVARFGRSVDGLVPEGVAIALKARFGG